MSFESFRIRHISDSLCEDEMQQVRFVYKQIENVFKEEVDTYFLRPEASFEGRSLVSCIQERNFYNFYALANHYCMSSVK